MGSRLFRLICRDALSGYGLNIRHNTLDERVIIQRFLVHQLTIHNAALGQSFPDGDGVDVVKSVLFRFGVEPILLDELGNSALYLGPGQFNPFWASGADHKQALAVTAAVFLSQPCGGIFFPPMLFHVADNGVFALNITIPCADGIINVILRERTQHFMEPWVSLVDDFPLQALAKLRHIGIEPNQLQITGAKNSAADGGVTFNYSVFIITMATGVAVSGILGNSFHHDGLVFLM